MLDVEHGPSSTGTTALMVNGTMIAGTTGTTVVLYDCNSTMSAPMVNLQHQALILYTVPRVSEARWSEKQRQIYTPTDGLHHFSFMCILYYEYGVRSAKSKCMRCAQASLEVQSELVQHTTNLLCSCTHGYYLSATLGDDDSVPKQWRRRRR